MLVDVGADGLPQLLHQRRLGVFGRASERVGLDQHRILWGGEGCRPHDAVAAAAALWPELFTYEPAHVGLDPNRFGRLERIDGAPNAEICTAVESAEVSRRLAQALFGQLS